MRSFFVEHAAIGGTVPAWARFLVKATLCLLVTLCALAQSDRGTITGTVMDPAAAVVPGAKIVVRNVDNGAVSETTTTGTGDYTLTSLPAGKYEVSVEANGFKKLTRENITVEVAQTTRVDLAVQVGASTETITVSTEAPMLRTENAEQSMNVSGEKVNDLPLNFGGGGGAGGGIRNWLSFMYLAPGVSGTNANSPGNNVVNGIPSGTYGNFKVYLEGQDATSINDASWTSTVSAAGVETIGEFSIQTSNFSAEFGQVAGGLFNFTTKSGTNQIHGSAYEYWANEAMDAAHPFSHALDRDRKNDYGFTVGGPVYIPKLYNGRNKTFFFFNLERFGNNQRSSGAYGTVPTAAYRNGDFGAALTGKTLTDPNTGYQFPENAIYDPLSTFTDANGHAMRTQFPNNVIPQNRMDPVALKMQALIPAAINGQTTLNWLPSISTNTTQQLPSLKIDENLNDSTKLSFYWRQQHTNQIAAPDGLPSPITGERPKLVSGNQYIANADRTVSPTLMVHLGASFYRFINPDSSPASVLNYDAVGLLGLTGSATSPAGFPELFSMGVNNQGGEGQTLGPTTSDHQYTDMLGFVAAATWVHSSHTLKFGAEAKQNVYSDVNIQGAQGQYTFGNGPTAIPYLGTQTVGAGAIGAGYASFLLGQVTSSNVNAPRDTQMRNMVWSAYAQDDWKVNRKLTLTYGLRWDFTPMAHELNNNQAEIGINTPNPSAGGLPGGYIFAGNGPGRCNCQFARSYPYGFGPRLGAAYQLNDKTVVRAGWGLTYSSGDSWGYLNGGMPVAGLGFNSVTASTGYGYAVSQLQNGIQYNPSVLYARTLNPGVAPGPGSLAPAPGWAAQFIDPDGGRPSRVNQWNVALQRQLSPNMTIEAAYVGNRGVWEQAQGLLALNAISPARLQTLGLNLTNPATRSLLTSSICSTGAAAAGYKLPYANYPCSANVAQSLRPFPEYANGLPAWFDPLGNSWYDALQVKFVRHFSRGLDLSSSFSYQKEQCLGSNGCAGINDAFNRGENKGLNPSSTPFLWVTAFTYELPKLGTNKLLRQVVGGWTFGGILRYASGNLIGVPASNNNMSAYTFNTNTRMMPMAGVPMFLKNPNCGCIDPNSNQQILNPAAWVDAPAGTWGQGASYYNDYRWQHQDSENLNIGRTFRLREKMNLSIRADFFNTLNRVYLPTPSATNPFATSTFNKAGVPTAGYGYIINSSNIGGQRNGQLVARFEF
ncbi:MAG: carboxypeptidase regulatory-like domain-containing protein [Candidatus Sulfopaludibacter sp.]|nr:carboxypeptidase regulatory-like domain-containing protein [Candidatus Sulfopaludibacter sp.]